MNLKDSLTVSVFWDYVEQKCLRCAAGYSLKEMLYAWGESVSFQHRCIRYLNAIFHTCVFGHCMNLPKYACLFCLLSYCISLTFTELKLYPWIIQWIFSHIFNFHSSHWRNLYCHVVLFMTGHIDCVHILPNCHLFIHLCVSQWWPSIWNQCQAVLNS